MKEAIGDLPACEPFYDEEHHKKRKSHTVPELNITWHKPRYHNLRDMDTFRILAKDIESGKREYNSKKISELYEKRLDQNLRFIDIMYWNQISQAQRSLLIYIKMVTGLFIMIQNSVVLLR